jgi:hypothetical protein
MKVLFEGEDEEANSTLSGQIMNLKSRIFKGDPVFEACLVRDSAHIVPGAVGKHVSKIHTALFLLGNLDIDDRERKGRVYGSSTVKAVLAYKEKRKIINRSYEDHVDPIVGKMTIAWLDKEMFSWENNPEDIRKRPEIRKVYETLPEALNLVRSARVRLFAIRGSYGSTSSLPFFQSERKVVEWNWKAQRAPNPVAHLDRILGVYDRMNETLFMASRPGNTFQLFLPSKGVPGEPGDPAYTTLGGYYYGPDEMDPITDEYKRAIYITPEFTNKVFAASILIHELAHYCGGKQGSTGTIEHRASPKPPPRGRRLEDGLHDYAGMTADEAYRNAQSYQCYCFPNSLGKPPDSF